MFARGDFGLKAGVFRRQIYRRLVDAAFDPPRNGGAEPGRPNGADDLIGRFNHVCTLSDALCQLSGLRRRIFCGVLRQSLHRIAHAESDPDQYALAELLNVACDRTDAGRIYEKADHTFLGLRIVPLDPVCWLASVF